MDRARMNSAIRVFNDAIIATDGGGMVSEKVRGLILYQSMIRIMVMVLCQLYIMVFYLKMWCDVDCCRRGTLWLQHRI